MKAAFGILALYVSIPLAIVAAQTVVTRQAVQPSLAQHATMAVLSAPATGTPAGR